MRAGSRPATVGLEPDTYAVAAPGEPLFQAAAANLNPWTEAKVDTKNPERGPLLILDGELDNTVPWSIANASYKQQAKNSGVTEIQKIAGRGHALTIDSGWQEVAEISLAFVQRYLPGSPNVAVPIVGETEAGGTLPSQETAETNA